MSTINTNLLAPLATHCYHAHNAGQASKVLFSLWHSHGFVVRCGTPTRDSHKQLKDTELFWSTVDERVWAPPHGMEGGWLPQKKTPLRYRSKKAGNAQRAFSLVDMHPTS